MKLVDDDEFTGRFRQHEKLTKLERQLFAHVVELGDLRNLSGLYQVTYEVLSDDIDDPLAMDLSRIMVAQAVEDVVRDPMRDMSNVPHGISRAERFAAYFEQDCPFCESRVDLSPVSDEEVDEDCECCAMLVRDWRAEHAEALRTFRDPKASTTS
jgi:hypothetical protein